MSSPLVVSVEPGSPADRAGLLAGDEVVTLNGRQPRDIIEWRQLTDEEEVEVGVRRGGLAFDLLVTKAPGAPLGAEVSSALFDQVRTCDNHCEFCFIHQLPPGLRTSLYVKDDDYRLSFLYGNYTTLTRFTEMDLERVVTERLGPLNVSIHATDPDLRSRMLRNRRGATSLRWLAALLEHDIEVHGQIVVCPGVNDGAMLQDTLCGILDRYPKLASACVVPLGVSRWSKEASLRAHTQAEAAAVVDLVSEWQGIFASVLGRPLVFAADEYYLVGRRRFPDAAVYGSFSQHEDGVGMARALELEFMGQCAEPLGPAPGFFAWVDGAPASGYRAPRISGDDPLGVNAPLTMRSELLPTGDSLSDVPPSEAPALLTGEYGAQVLRPLLARAGFDHVEVIAVENRFFGGNIAVTGLMVGSDLSRVLSAQPVGRRYLLPDVCLSGGRFLDGTTVADLPRPVEVIGTDGISLRAALRRRRSVPLAVTASAPEAVGL